MEWQEADELRDSDDDSDDETMMPSSSSFKVVSLVFLKMIHKNLLYLGILYCCVHLSIAALMTR